MTEINRRGEGARIPMQVFADHLGLPVRGQLGWKHVHFIATMWAESGGLEWVRPIVWNPGSAAHLSIDRGICQLNSHWWPDVPDSVAYDWRKATDFTVGWLNAEAAKWTRGSTPWNWGPLLDWQWHGYGTVLYTQFVAPARTAVNASRSVYGLSPV